MPIYDKGNDLFALSSGMIQFKSISGMAQMGFGIMYFVNYFFIKEPFVNYVEVAMFGFSLFLVVVRYQTVVNVATH